MLVPYSTCQVVAWPLGIDGAAHRRRGRADRADRAGDRGRRRRDRSCAGDDPGERRGREKTCDPELPAHAPTLRCLPAEANRVGVKRVLGEWKGSVRARLSAVILENGIVRTLDPSLPAGRALAIAGAYVAGGVGVHETALASPEVVEPRRPLRPPRLHRLARPLPDLVARAAPGEAGRLRVDRGGARPRARGRGRTRTLAARLRLARRRLEQPRSSRRRSCSTPSRARRRRS